ncbi:diadenylate cyclase CdaA [Salirhabdus sp. Marseille-P4669]|uniref:diadenylate cyclase CdaA n=1 Tax=Salirhabdus sp. Marseille-P4669 TaxID=2042310 RepID=UPI000C7AB3DA|nr:diadenylate cyclase CdaA [Salirhabdus sp. Marseille-P4669]
MSDGGFDFVELLRIIIDIALVWFVLYKLFMLVRGTKAVQLIKGIVVILAIFFLSFLFQLQTVQWLMEQALAWGFVIVAILFQPELRRALEQLGRGKFFSRNTHNEQQEMQDIIEAIVKSCNYMAKRRIGALISMQLETGMGDYVETGIPIRGKITSELLTNIFVPNTPLHDGAVILSEDQIVAAACYLPLSESPFISKELGTRHRAALGVSEVTDALTIVVSEETGSISITKNGELHRNLDEHTIREMLKNALNPTFNQATKGWIWRGKKNG